MRESSKSVPASWMAMAFPSTSLDTDVDDDEDEASLLRLLLPPVLILDGLMVFELCCNKYVASECFV